MRWAQYTPDPGESPGEMVLRIRNGFFDANQRKPIAGGLGMTYKSKRTIGIDRLPILAITRHPLHFPSRGLTPENCKGREMTAPRTTRTPTCLTKFARCLLHEA